MGQQHDVYFVPAKSYWPIVAAVVMFIFMFGAGHWLNAEPGATGFGKSVFVLGVIGVLGMFFGWFRLVIRESLAGDYNHQVDTSFRMGMMWFIFSEVMFFGAFFGALYWARMHALPNLGDLDNAILWPDFKAVWPTHAVGVTGSPAGTVDAFTTMGPWPIPTINTALLLSSGVTLTIAHHALLAGRRAKTIGFMWLTVLLGITFLGFQVYEYMHAYGELNLKLTSGTYGSTFFLLTGFHGFHVFVGMLMLLFITIRLMKGHFTPERHFGFEGAAWYWHFVDVVWLGLYIVVYWL